MVLQAFYDLSLKESLGIAPQRSCSHWCFISLLYRHGKVGPLGPVRRSRFCVESQLRAVIPGYLRDLKGRSKGTHGSMWGFSSKS